MRIVKTAEIQDKYDIQRIIANMGCDKCPCCGEDKDFIYYLRKGIVQKGVDKLLMTRNWTKEGFFSKIKHMQCDVYKCHTCGAEWESEPYEWC